MAVLWLLVKLLHYQVLELHKLIRVIWVTRASKDIRAIGLHAALQVRRQIAAVCLAKKS